MKRSSSPAPRYRSTAGSTCTEASTGLRPSRTGVGSFHSLACGASFCLKEDQPMNAPRNTRYRYIETRRIAGSLGAEVTGVDLSEDLPEDLLAEIRAALLDNCVIFFRDQKLTPEQQLRFARRWGEIHLHPFMQGMPDHPEILEIIKTPED